MKKLLTGLFRSAKKKLALTRDGDGAGDDTFRAKLGKLVSDKDTMDDESIAGYVDNLKADTDTLPDDDGKAQLVRFLEDFKSVKDQDPETAAKAADAVSDLYERLDAKAGDDVPEKVENTVEEKTETSDADETDETAEQVVEETVAPENGKENDETQDEGDDADAVSGDDAETTDGDENPEYEKIYQYIKERMAKDAESAAVDPADDETTDADEKENDDTCDTCTSDHAPHIAVKVTNDNAPAGSLAEMFAKIKGVK